MFLVADTSDEDRELALKVCALPVDSADWAGGGPELERFRREFTTLSILRHPGIPRVHDFGLIPAAGSSPERWFFTYDFVEGQDLYTWSRNQGPEALLRVAEELIDTLRFLHAKGLLHLDIKPSNIIVQSTLKGPRSKLIDFGIVRRFEHLTLLPSLGTLPYMAPELFRGEAVGPAADFFSLGVTLFECLFRQRPYRGDSPERLRKEHQGRLPAPPPGLTVRGGEKLESLIWCLLSRDPARRLLEIAPESGELRSSISSFLFSNRPIGMEEPLEALYGAYHAATEGCPAPSLFFISGEAGSGKSRLLAELKNMVQVSGGRFLQIAPRDAEPVGRDGLGALTDALTVLLRSRKKPARALERLKASRKFSFLLEGELAPVRRDQARLKCFEAIWSHLQNILKTSPLVIAFEDVQDCDEATLALINYLARNIHLENRNGGDQRVPSFGRERHLRVLLCATFRPEEILGKMADFLGEPYVRKIQLEPLNRNQVRSFLENTFGSQGITKTLVHALHTSSRGNPFVLVETLKSLLEEGALFYRPGRPLEVRTPPARWHLPGSVKELMRGRWERLRGEERRLASILALAPGKILQTTLSQMIPLSSKTTSDLMARLEEKLILVREGQGKKAALAIAHPHLRDLARAAWTPQAFRRAHEKLASIREQEGANPEELAFLFIRAKNRKKALHYTLEAASAMQEPGAAFRLKSLYEGLLEILPDRDRHRWKISLELAKVRSLLGDHQGAVELLEPGLSKKYPPRDLARRLSLLANERIYLRQLNVARREFQEAGRLLADQPEAWEEMVQVRLGICRLESEAGNNEAAMRSARESLLKLNDAPPGSHRDFLQSSILSKIGSLCTYRSEFSAAIEAFRQSYQLLRGHEDSLEKGGLCCNLANLYTARGEYDQAIRYYQRARKAAERIGARDLEALVNANLGLQYLYRWDLPRAEEFINSAVHVAETIGAKRYLSFARLCLGTMLARRGDLPEAIQLFREERRRSRIDKDPYLSVNIGYQAVKAYLDRGEFTRALSLALSSRRLAGKIGRAKSILEGNLTLGAVFVTLGDFQRGLRYLKEAQRSPAENHPHVDAEILFFLGLGHLGAGDVARAEEYLSHAARSFQSLRITLRVSEVHLHLARAAQISGKTEEAGRLCDRAWRFLGQLRNEDRPVILWAEALVNKARLLGHQLPAGSATLLDLLHDLNTAHELLIQRGSRRLLWQVSHQLAILHHTLGNREKALVLLDEARRTLEELSGSLSNRLAGCLRKTPEARALLEQAAWEDQESTKLGVEKRGFVELSSSERERLRRLENAHQALLEENRRLREENEKLTSRVVTQKVQLAFKDREATSSTPSIAFFGLVGSSPPMERLYHLIQRIAATDLSVLVRGETGSGKDLVMRAIHQASPRRGGPFVMESLAAVPSGLLESELFGYQEGAFSDASRDKPGRLASASGGTLCLSEIDELPLEAQAKLLHVLKSGHVRPLGSSEVQQVDFRLIASTRQDLRQAVEEGRFHEKLLYLLQGIEVFVPPLRERREDIPLLIDHFLAMEEKRSGRRTKIDAEALQKLLDHHWPGNVRELENEIRRLSILGTGRIRASDLRSLQAREPKPEAGILIPGALEKLSWVEARNALDRAYFEEALKRQKGSLKGAARELGVHERTAYKIRKRLGLE